MTSVNAAFLLTHYSITALCFPFMPPEKRKPTIYVTYICKYNVYML